MEKFRFENLIVYQKSLDYLDLVYEMSGKFPQHETYALSSQFRRASASISLNIGEGEGGTKKEYLNFLRISRRSVRECVVCTTIAKRRNYISEKEEDNSRNALVELSKMLSGLMNSLMN